MAEAHSVVSKQKYPGIQTSATQAGVLLAIASLRVENWKAGFSQNEFLIWHFSPVSVGYGWEISLSGVEKENKFWAE